MKKEINVTTTKTICYCDDCGSEITTDSVYICSGCGIDLCYHCATKNRSHHFVMVAPNTLTCIGDHVCSSCLKAGKAFTDEAKQIEKETMAKYKDLSVKWFACVKKAAEQRKSDEDNPQS